LRRLAVVRLHARIHLGALALIGACSVVNAPGDHRRPIPANEFCPQWAEVICRAAFECCPAGPPTDPRFTREECEREKALECSDQYGSLAVDPRTGYDEELAARVIHEGHAFVDACDVEFVDWFFARDGFQSVFQGTVAGGVRCDRPTARDPAPLFSCRERGQSCILTSPALWTCQAQRDVGEPCLIDYDCRQPELYCEGPLFAGRCERRREVGALCTEKKQCQSYVCSGGRCAERTQNDVFCGLARSPTMR
jgi:hypothetical protein